MVVQDETVSWTHARLVFGPSIQLETQTTTNGTFLNKRSLDIGNPEVFPQEECRLQLGGVLFAVKVVTETVPVLEPMSTSPRADELSPRKLPVEPEPTEWMVGQLQVCWDGVHCVARWRGRDLGLTGVEARLLGILAEQPGRVVRLWDLKKRLKTEDIARPATEVRRALAKAVRDGLILRAFLRDRLNHTLMEVPADLELESLMRLVIQSKRENTATRSNLLPEAVLVERKVERG